MMRRLTLFGVFVLGLAGCEPAVQGARINDELVAAFADKSADEIFPAVSSKTFLSGFRSICEANVKDLSKAIAALEANGYLLFVERGDVTTYAHPDGKQIFGFGGPNRRKPVVCMAMTRRTKNLRAAAEGYAAKLPSVLEIPIEGLARGAEKAWIPGEGQELLYLSINQKDPRLGDIYAFAVGTL